VADSTDKTSLHVIRNAAGQLWCEQHGWGHDGDIYDLARSLPPGGRFMAVQCTWHAFCTKDAVEIMHHPVRKGVPVCVHCKVFAEEECDDRAAD
jgi:hypothetical protein